MADALKVLTALARGGPQKLPRYKSGRSGDVFSRLTSRSNLQRYRDRGRPLDERVEEAMGFMKAIKELFNLYTAAFSSKAVGDSEVVEQVGSLLRTTALMFELVDEFLPTLRKDDPTYEVRMEGLAKMKRGFADVITGSLVILTEKGLYRAAERVRLIGYMKEALPPIIPKLTPGSRAAVSARLARMDRGPALEELQPALRELRRRVEAALPNGNEPGRGVR